jgi:starch phosphorylase
MKAAINGGINLSVLDGWWGEAYDGANGWAIKPASSQLDDARRAHEESVTLYELLQDHVAPLYYDRSALGYSPGWVRMAKHSVVSLLPRFNSTRMVTEYLRRSYLPASQQGRRYSENGFDAAKKVAAWKGRVRQAWAGVRVRRIDTPRTNIVFGEGIELQIAIYLNGLAASDVAVELIMGRPSEQPKVQRSARYELEWVGVKTDAGEDLFALVLTPELCGKLQYRIRVYPCHELLTHPLETGLMIWL